MQGPRERRGRGKAHSRKTGKPLSEASTGERILIAEIGKNKKPRVIP